MFNILFVQTDLFVANSVVANQTAPAPFGLITVQCSDLSLKDYYYSNFSHIEFFRFLR